MEIKNKRGFVPFLAIAILSVLAISSLVVTGVFDLSSIIGYEKVYKQNYGVIECVKNDAYDYQLPRWLDQQTEFSCDIYTDECEVVMEQTPIGLLSFSAGTYRIDGGVSKQYTISKGGSETLKINAGQTIKFKANIGTAGYTKINLKAKTFYIRGQENGKVYTQESCVLSSELKKKVLSDGLNELSFSGANKYQNYFIDFVAVASKTYQYNNKEVICQARQLYKVDELSFKDGSTRKVQGEVIKAVECCPNENNCNDNSFTFEKDEVRECQISSECSNSGDLFGIGQVKAGQYKCVDGSCELKEVSVDCTSTAVCLTKYGEGNVCDLSPDNWGVCVKTSAGQYCGDGYCDIGESKGTCPNDCELECSDGQKLVTTEKKVGAFCVFGFGVCDTEVTKECKDDSPNYLAWILWSLFIFLVLLAVIFRAKFFAIIKRITPL